MNLRRAGEYLSELMYPRRCPFCDSVIGRLDRCERCDPKLEKLWLAIPRLPATEHELKELSGAAAILKYEGLAQQAILRMKNGGKPCYAPLFAAEMAKRIFGCELTQKGGIIMLKEGPVLRRYDLVVPVPSAKDSTRGYNVPDLLACPLAEYLSLECDKNILVKVRGTEKQEGKTARQRFENVKNAYAVQNAERVENRRILLVDDVITTGATVSECAKTLLQAGAAEVFAVSVAETQYKGGAG